MPSGEDTRAGRELDAGASSPLPPIVPARGEGLVPLDLGAEAVATEDGAKPGADDDPSARSHAGGDGRGCRREPVGISNGSAGSDLDAGGAPREGFDERRPAGDPKGAGAGEGRGVGRREGRASRGDGEQHGAVLLGEWTPHTEAVVSLQASRRR